MNNNHTYIQNEVIKAFKLDVRNKSPKGWIQGAICPFCNQNDKFGIKLNKVKGGQYRNHISFNCYRGSCQEKGSEYKLLTVIGKGHLLKHGEFIGDTEKVTNTIIAVEEIMPKLEVPTVTLPFGFRRCSTHPYLVGRGFQPWQFETYVIGTTKLDTGLKNYIIFSVTEEGEHKGYVSRIVWDGATIDQYERSTGRRVAKYKNEGGVDFGKLLFGIDEITENTEQVILVEGVTDKTNVDVELELYSSEEVKCCATFGKKISEEQIVKLWLKGVRKVTLMYDPDAIEESKRYGHVLELWQMDVKVGYLSDKDPGELNREQIHQVLLDSKTPNQFSIDKVQKRKLQ